MSNDPGIGDYKQGMPFDERNELVKKMMEKKEGKAAQPAVPFSPQSVAIDPLNPLRCPYCAQPFEQFAGVTPGHSNTVRKGQYFICANCGNASVVGDSQLEQLTPERMAQVPDHVKRALGAVSNTLNDMSVRETGRN